PAGGRAALDCDSPGAGLEPEEIDVRPLLDDPRAADGRRSGHSRGGGAGPVVAVVVGHVAEPVLTGDDREVVFLVVRTEVLAATPLNERLVVTDAHDRGPPGRPGPVPGVVLREEAGGRVVIPVVAEPQRVPHLVADGVGRVLLVPVG